MFIENDSPSANEVLKFQSKRSVTIMFKNMLSLLEILYEEHDAALDKLYENLPEEYKKYVKLADYLDENKEDSLRKRVLDIGNDCYRTIEEMINNFNVTFK